MVESGNPTQFETYFPSIEKHFSISCICPSQGKFATVFRDITGSKKAQEALRVINEELEQRVQKRTRDVSLERQHLFTVLESLPVMLCLLTKEHHVAFTNRLFKERFGESRGRHCFDFLFGLNEPCKMCEAYDVLETGKPHYWRLDCPNGTVFDVYNSPFTDIDGSPMILEVDVDITEQVKMEKQLKDSERLATIGATAGMVGHDIRNPLQAIISDVYLAKTDLASTSDCEEKNNALESLDEIEKNIGYINKIVADLQDYARPLKPIAKETNLKNLINELLSKNAIPENIKVQVNMQKEAATIMADSDILKRILGNLVTNAVQAMPKGGKLSINAYKEGKDSFITVEDTGVGIPQAVKDKLFTPLFTTKSKGQGFGLAVVKRMTESLGGSVNFESKEGKGTTFIVRLPNQKGNP